VCPHKQLEVAGEDGEGEEVRDEEKAVELLAVAAEIRVEG